MSPYDAAGRGRRGSKRSCGPCSHDEPSVTPGKQGLEATPSPTCRGHLESGPGTGTGDKNVARALNKGSQQGRPGRPCSHHHHHASKTGAQGVGRMLRQDRAPKAQAPDEGWAAWGELAPSPTRGPRSFDSSKFRLRQRVGRTQCESTTAGPSKCLAHRDRITSHHCGGLTPPFYR